jgi:tetratricopeptide (TPR) repeat protein
MDELERTPETSRGGRFYAIRAALFLSVGRVPAATADIDRSIALAPNDGIAYALQSVLNVVLNRREQAVEDGRRAVELSPSPAARIALSYAQQAAFQLEAARDTLLAAVEVHPDNALAWARLAELRLALGDRKAATAAAERALALQPGLSRTHNVLGFTALAELRTARAQAAFERAIALQSADPLPHLGLGLAKIRRGQLHEGRSEIEAAVALDSNNALLRAYLGKAYFEERRGPLDAQQLEIAKGLDPLDPTAYFYNAIRLQTENQPVTALRELEASIERNDNRAVYRSRLLLDQDRAARGVSQARIVSDLGFSQLGINESTSSLSADPGNAAAHRFLSDTYRDVRRREVARVSELLQAQMLQDVNINPVQPSVSETNLNVVTQGGPATAGYNEYTPLFERNRASVLVSGVVGNNDTVGGESVVSGVYDSFSVSAGLFHYETEGWRANNDLRQDVGNVFAQWAVSPQFNVQAEYRQRESEEGDLAFNFDPDDIVLDQSVERDTETARVGLRISPASNSDVLVSYIHNDRTEDAESSRPDDIFGLADFGIRIQESTRTDDKGEQLEGQYLWRGTQVNLIAGLGHSEVDRHFTSDLTALDPLGVFGPPGGSFPVDSEDTRESIDHNRGYLYANVNLSDSMIGTIGVSYEEFEQKDFDQDGFYPKFGLRWQFNEAVSARVAAFKVMKPVLVSNRTLEPTQIAGFNQFFDDINATTSKRYAGGVEWTVNDQFKLGGELTLRYLDEPVFVGSDAVIEDREEEYHRVYSYWTPTSNLAVNAQLVYDLYKSDDGIATTFDNLPERVRTVSLPIGVTYFRPSGLFAGVVGTYVDQRVERAVTATQADGNDQFFVFDASLGYRLPKRRGTISLGVRNLFDTDFNYQDDSYREFRDEPSTGPYFPDRTILGQVTLSF